MGIFHSSGMQAMVASTIAEANAAVEKPAQEAVSDAPAAAAPVARAMQQVAKAANNPFRKNGSSTLTGGGSGSSSSTLLTGPTGIDDAALSLGKNKLLGQ